MSHGIAEWVFNFIILVFATSMIAQPEVIPTSSMEDNLLIGDHVIVDEHRLRIGGAAMDDAVPDPVEAVLADAVIGEPALDRGGGSGMAVRT